MKLTELIKQVQQEFTNLKDKITTKLTEKDAAIQTEKDKAQETVLKLETALKEQDDSEKVLQTLLKDFQELTQQLE